MLEFYFSYRGVLKRLRSGALGGEMDRFAEHFLTLGYKRASAKIYLCRIARFSQFAATRCGLMPIQSIKMSSTAIWARLLQILRASGPFRLWHTHGECLRSGSLFPFQVKRLTRMLCFWPPFRTICARYGAWSRRPAKVFFWAVAAFWIGSAIAAPAKNLEALTAEHVLAAVEHRLSLSATSGTRTAATSHIRTFLRFLCWAGHHRQDLARIVPRTPYWRLAPLPPRLAWGDVRRAIDAIGATTPVAIRDRAVLLLLAITGIRNGELRAIRLQDIDWRTGEVFIRRTKGKRDRVVPLLEETGAALVDCILRARPKVDSPYLFLSFTPPVGAFKSAAPVSRIVRKRLRHGGVADLPSHGSINTTALYVKVTASQLAEVALPFPGGAA